MYLAEIDQQDILEPAAPIRASIDEEGREELAQAFKEIGLLHPPSVAKRVRKYEIIAGHRRLLATRLLGMPKVPVIVADSESEDTLIAGRVHENIIRRDISPVEEAAFYAELMEKYQDIDRVCALAHRTRNIVESRLLLLAGDQDVLAALNDKKISLAVAVELNREHNDQKRKWFLEFAVKDGATMRTVDVWRRSYQDFLPAELAMDTAPVVSPDGKQAVAQRPRCYLCGGDDQQHTMRWVVIHSSCHEVAHRLGWQIQADVEGENAMRTKT